MAPSTEHRGIQDELAFAERAGLAFSRDIMMTAYSDEALLGPGSLLALRSINGKRNVLVVRLAENHQPTVYENLIKEKEHV